MENRVTKLFRGNTTNVSLNVMGFKLWDRELTGIQKFMSLLKINFDVQ